MTFLSLCLFLSACGSTSSTTPTPATATLTGTWKGNLDLQGTASQMTWTLAQNGTAVTGPVLVVLPTGTVLLNGALNGALNGSAFSFTITIAPGAIPSQPTCTGRLDGTATANLTVATPTLTGTYTLGVSSCATPFSSGTFTLTRQ